MADSYEDLVRRTRDHEASLRGSWYALTNEATGDAIVADNFAMVRQGLVCGQPQDLDRPEWADGGREYDSMLWMIDDGDMESSFGIVNKKSGLSLGAPDAGLATLVQQVEPARWRAVPWDDGFQLYLLDAGDPGNKVAKAWDGKKLTQVNPRKTWRRSNLTLANRDADHQENAYTWEFRRIDYQSRAFAKLQIDKGNKEMATAQQALLLSANVLASTGAMIKGILEALDMKKPSGIVAAVFSGTSGVLRLTADILGFTLQDEAHRGEDPIIKLYDTMLPEIRRIVEQTVDEAMIEAHVEEAMKDAKSGREGVTTAVAMIEAAVPADIAAQVAADPAAFPDLDRALGGRQAAISAELEAASDHCMAALNGLIVRFRPWVYFPVWSAIAREMVAVEALRFAVDPEAKRIMVAERLGQLVRDGSGTRDDLVEERMAKIDEAARKDLHYRLGRDFALPPDAYQAHVRRVLEITFGHPTLLIDQLAALKRAIQPG